jgi:hypothetical protein
VGEGSNDALIEWLQWTWCWLGGKIKVMFERRYTSKPIRTSGAAAWGCVRALPGAGRCGAAQPFSVDLHVVTRRSSNAVEPHCSMRALRRFVCPHFRVCVEHTGFQSAVTFVHRRKRPDRCKRDTRKLLR